jgi:hypothetical protein
MADLPISSLPFATTGYSNSLMPIVNYNPISTGRTEALPYSSFTSTFLTGITINNNVNDNLITATGSPNTLNGEVNAKFDGTTLILTKNSASPNISLRDTGSTQDAFIRFLSTSASTPSYAFGVDRSDNNIFKLSYSSGSGAVLGTNDLIKINWSGGTPIYNLGPNVNSVQIETATDSARITVRDSVGGVDSSFTRFTNYSEIDANSTSSNEPFYINNSSTSGLTSFGGSGTNDQMIFYPSVRTDLPTIGGSGLYIKQKLRVDKEISVGTVSSTGVALYRNATTGILTTTSSDVRLKENIIPISGATDIVKNLRGVYFNYKNAENFEVDDQSRQIGMIAQEVESFLPEAVTFNGISDYKTIRYSEMVSLLVESTKEQQKIIERLTTEIESLKTRVSNLESRNS